MTKPPEGQVPENEAGLFKIWVGPSSASNMIKGYVGYLGNATEPPGELKNLYFIYYHESLLAAEKEKSRKLAEALEQRISELTQIIRYILDDSECELYRNQAAAAIGYTASFPGKLAPGDGDRGEE